MYTLTISDEFTDLYKETHATAHAAWNDAVAMVNREPSLPVQCGQDVRLAAFLCDPGTVTTPGYRFTVAQS